VLSGSNFEIDTDANLKVDGASPCIDWLTGGAGTGLRPPDPSSGDQGVLTKNDKPSGANDDSFGQGTSENDTNPTIVDGSIPPNKSDLKTFGVYTETTASGKFLELFWTRINSPEGTTNMDFELNQKFCDPSATPTNCANNSHTPPETPIRTSGDKLITYDLSRGGTVPTISIRTWDGTSWSAPTVISGPGDKALGSVNTSTIPANQTGGINEGNPLDPFTFGEAAINFNALFSGNQCGKFGSAYLKSRSSDSFQAEIKDFIAPERVNISNCTTLTTSAKPSVTIGSPIHDTATLSNATSNAGGTITFHLFSDNQCQNEINTGLSPVSVSGNGDYNSGDFTPNAVGTYYWTASYSGDANNKSASTQCGDPGESSVVNKAESSISTAQELFPQDSGTVSASAGGTPSGDITFKLFGPDNSTCDPQGANPVYTETVNVNGTGKASTSNSTFSVKSANADSYKWLVVYSGDANHEGATSACGTEHFTVTIANG